MKKFLIGLLLLTFVLPVFGQNQDEFKFSLVPRRLAIPAMTGYVTTDGLTPLTADWNVGAFNLTAKNYTAAETLGAELITNVAGFTPNVGGDWSYAAGAWTHTGAGYNILTANWTPTADHDYKVQFTVSDASGNTAFQMGGSTFQYGAYSGVQTYYVHATGTGAPIFCAYTGFTGSFSAFSIKEVTNGTISAHNISPTGSIILENGTGDSPSLTFKNNRGTGLFCYSDTYLEFTSNHVNFMTGSSSGLILNTLPLFIGGGSDLKLTRDAAASMQLGTDAAAPVAQTFKAHDGLGANIAGANLTIGGGRGTGSGIGGSVIIATAPAATSASTENALVNRISVDETGLTTFIGSSGITIKLGTNTYFGYLKSNDTNGVSLWCTSSGVLGNGVSVLPTSFEPTADIVMDLGTTGARWRYLNTEEIKANATDGVQIIPAQITPGTGTGLTVNSAGNLNQLVYKAVVSYTGFSSAGSLTADKTIATLPAKTKIIRIYARTTTPFAGTGVTAVTLCVGKSAGGVEYIATHDVKTAAYNAGDLDADMGTEMTRAAAVQGGSIIDWVNPITVVARITTTTAHTDDLTAGSVTFIIETARY